MDKDYISALEDTYLSINKKISLIEKYISEYTLSNSSSNQNKLLSKINVEFENMKIDLRLMKTDIMSLQDSSNQQSWKSKYSSIKSQKEKLEDKVKNIKSNINNKENEEEDYKDINKKVNLSKLSSEQVMKRGDMIMDDTDKSLQNIVKTLNKGRDIMKETNKELNRQMEAMDRVDGELNEMDGSLERSKKTINDINKSNNCLIW